MNLDGVPHRPHDDDRLRSRPPGSPRPSTSSRSADAVVVEVGGTSTNVSVV